jgi:hypothetical protein
MCAIVPTGSAALLSSKTAQFDAVFAAPFPPPVLITVRTILQVRFRWPHITTRYGVPLTSHASTK